MSPALLTGMPSIPGCKPNWGNNSDNVDPRVINMQVTALLVLFAAMAGADKAAAPVSPRVLQLGSSQSLEVPSFRFYGAVQSDKDGNLYFHVDAGSYREPVILKLARGSGDPTLYTVADEDQKNIVFGEFSVTPFGQVVLLGQGTDGKTYAIRFSSKGAPTTKTALAFPEHMSIGNFIAFESGSLLVSAFYLPDAPAALRGKSFLALFDESGQIRKRFDQELAPVDLSSVSQHLYEGGATVGPDGNLYLLTPDKIVVMSESGEIVRRMKYQKPEGGAASQIAVSHNLVSIWLLKEGPKNQISSEYLVLDLFTGKPFGFYVPGNEFGPFAIAISFSNQEGFTFFDTENGHVKLLSAPLR